MKIEKNKVDVIIEQIIKNFIKENYKEKKEVNFYMLYKIFSEHLDFNYEDYIDGAAERSKDFLDCDLCHHLESNEILKILYKKFTKIYRMYLKIINIKEKFYRIHENYFKLILVPKPSTASMINFFDISKCDKDKKININTVDEIWELVHSSSAQRKPAAKKCITSYLEKKSLTASTEVIEILASIYVDMFYIQNEFKRFPY